MRVVKRVEADTKDDSYVVRLVEEFKRSKEFMEREEKRLSAMKKELSEYVEANGEVDNNGHRWLKVGDFELKRERRVSRSFNRAKAEQWVDENGYWEVVGETVTVLSEDKLLALAWEDKSLEPTIQAFYEEKETWAFKA